MESSGVCENFGILIDRPNKEKKQWSFVHDSNLQFLANGPNFLKFFPRRKEMPLEIIIVFCSGPLR
jgi:hypothetical protein